jgi:spermidine/putrescine transport system substrate-binding protein
MPISLNRRQFSMLALGSLAAPALARAQTAAGETITVLNWQGYGTDEPWALKAFTEKTGITVKHEYFNAESEMVTKVRTNPGAYDVVLVNSARVRQLGAEMLIPIDQTKIPNNKSIPDTLSLHPNFVIDGKPYGNVWVWGMTGLAARTGKAKTGDSLSVLADPAFVNRVAMNDDPIIAVGIGALMSGQDMTAPKDLKLVGEKLKSLKKNIHLLWQSEDEWNKAFAADQFDLSVYWSGSAIRSRRNFKLPVDFIVAKEGAIAWVDTLTVPISSTKQEAAYAFINYMIDPDFYFEWATKVGAPASANPAAMAKLPADDLNKLLYKPDYLQTMQMMGALSDETRQSFVDLWEETKAFYAN